MHQQLHHSGGGGLLVQYVISERERGGWCICVLGIPLGRLDKQNVIYEEKQECPGRCITNVHLERITITKFPSA